jgi:hypothetical protein
MGTCLFAKPLFSNGSCIFAYLAVVAQQRVCMPQYYGTWVHLSCVLHKSLLSVRVSVCVFPLSLLDSGSVDTFPRQRTHETEKNCWTHVFYAACVISKESLWTCLYIPLSLLGNGSVNTFPQQQRIDGGVGFYTVNVVSKGSRRLVLPRTSCSSMLFKRKK